MSTLEALTVDLTDTATFVDGPPHGFFAELRRSAPVWRHPATSRHPGFWVVSRYDDVHAVLLQPSTFINARGITIDPNEPAGLSGDEPERGQGALSYTDPPDHRPLRHLLSRHFTPGRMRALAPLVETHARRLVRRLADAGGGDFIAQVADPYPLRVLAAVLELPSETEAALKRFVQTTGTDEHKAAVTVDFLAAADELAQARARKPGDDLISAMVAGGGEGAALAAERFGGILVQLAIAGNETTRAASGHGVRLLAQHPEQMALVAADPASAVPAMVEEVLRLRPPVHYTRRTVSAATEEAPVLGSGADALLVEPGDVVYLSIASANRDERFVDDADLFDVGRTPAPSHLSLGVGEHYCLGAALARLELRSLFAAVAEEMPWLHAAGGESTPSTMFDSLASLPVWR
jgi:cholest-4-en-3-one 26-monooxygenase